MPNLLQEKLEQLKSFQKQLKHKKFTRKDIAVAVTVAMALTTVGCVSSFSPGGINYAKADHKEQKVSIGEFTKPAGPPQTVSMKEENPLKRKVQQKLNTEKTTQVPSLPTGAFGGLHTPSKTPFGGDASGLSAETKAPQEAYNPFKDLTDRMRSILSDSFTLKSISDPPKFAGKNRFTASFENADGAGNVLEKLELMSITRTSNLKDITTAQKALDSLVEESQSVHILESHDSYLIYEYAGNGGYQIGKISVDDQTINIFGYVNLTTSEMPDILKTEWINHFQSDL